MDCPSGHGPMLRGQTYWLCETCTHRVPLAGAEASVSDPLAPHLAQLPSIVAIPLREYVTEVHPVLRLHRLCDAVEILTRFCTIVELGELRRKRHHLRRRQPPEGQARVLPRAVAAEPCCGGQVLRKGSQQRAEDGSVGDFQGSGPADRWSHCGSFPISTHLHPTRDQRLTPSGASSIAGLVKALNYLLFWGKRAATGATV